MSIYDKNEIRIILADDHEVVRVGLKRLFSIDKSIVILAEANNGKGVIELVDYYKPDIALIDILMPIMDGIEATKIIKQTVPETLCVLLTAFEDALHLEQALEAGANGYLTKDITSRELIKAIHTVFRGERVFSKTIISLLQKKQIKYEDQESNQSIIITKREQEIVNLVAKGMTSPAIAEYLSISVRTVQTHRANIMKKLKVNNAAGLVRYAMSSNPIHND